MEKKTFKSGFLIGGGLIGVGLLLELCIGPVVWDAFAWPVNGFVLAAFLAMIVVMHLLRKRFHIFRFISTSQAAIPAVTYAVLLTIIMGLTRQDPEGRWLHNMLSFWPFVLVYVYMTVILGMAMLRRNLRFLLNHLGLFIVLVTATLGNADRQQLKMVAVPHNLEWRAVDDEQRVHELPFAIELQQFVKETYDDGTPRRFASEVKIVTRDGKDFLATVEVNRPVKVEGWKIYQYGYDTPMGSMSRSSILELVRDPWLPFVYAGIFMMLVGALFLLSHTRWSYKRLIPIAALIAVALCIVSHFMPVIRSTQLVPALQSPWFTPHILVYIICYSLMGVAALIAIYQLLFRPRSLDLSDNLVYVGFIFMTFGMMFGAFWANEAWGNYWSWDPKETWAAITWFAYLIYIHYRQLPKHNPRLALCLLVLSFVLLQMCWWGINYLPSAQGASVHVY